MINSITIQGRLVADPELKTTQGGTELCKFTIACDRKPTKDKDKVTDFVPCVVWGAYAKTINNYFSKGQMIICHGRIAVDPYTDKQGNKRSYTTINVDEFAFAGEKGEKKQTSKPAAAPKRQPQQQEYEEITIPDDEDLPF